MTHIISISVLAAAVCSCAATQLPLDTWRRQERAFGLLRKVYAKQAVIRGQQHHSY